MVCGVSGDKFLLINQVECRVFYWISSVVFLQKFKIDRHLKVILQAVMGTDRVGNGAGISAAFVPNAPLPLTNYKNMVGSVALLLQVGSAEFE